jgi:hypothetical protein
MESQIRKLGPMNDAYLIKADVVIAKIKLALEKLKRVLAEHRVIRNPKITDTMVVEATEWITSATLAVVQHDNVKDKRTDYPGVVILMTKTLALPLLSGIK